MVSATTLVLPLLAIGAAQAAPTADLSITKTVSVAKAGTIVDASQFIAAMSDVRNAGTAQFVDAGLRVRTTGTTDKVAQYWPQSGPIPSTASIAWTQDEGIFMPGMQIVFDTDGILGNGIGDWNILVNVPSDNGSNWWLSNSSSAIAKAAAPSCNNPGPACVGLVNGYPWYGTLPAWIAAIPTAQVYAVGFSIGSGAGGINSGTISTITYGTQRYDFAGFSSSIQAAPGETVEYKLTVTNSGSATAAADSVVVTDTLPADLTYVAGSLVDNGNGCGFVAKNLTCNAGTFPVGTSTTIKFKAKVSSTVTSAGLQATTGHHVDVQKQEVFANLPADGQPQAFNVMCPAGYLPTDGGLLIDSVDQGGYYSDIVVSVSKPTELSGIKGWTVTATNLGEERGQGKVKVTCLDETIGSSNGHTHAIVVTGSTGTGVLSAASANPTDVVTRTCPVGYTPVAPQHQVTSGLAVVRGSYATANTWSWTVDHEAGTAATFDVSCLAPETTSSNGHPATLTLSTASDTISVAPESRDEGIQQCLSNANAITGGFEGTDASVLSLGKEQRGNNYMFRFYNDDWDLSHNARIQVACVGVRTPDEAQYYHVVNTATVSTSTPDNSAGNSSSADISIVGDPAVPASGVIVGGTAGLSGSAGHRTAVVLQITCPSACSFSVRVIEGGNVVAKATKSLTASPTPRSVSVPTTSAGKNLAPGDQVSVKVKTEDGTGTRTVTLS